MLYISCLICYSADTPDTSVCGQIYSISVVQQFRVPTGFTPMKIESDIRLAHETKTDFARKILIRFPESETDLGELVSDSKPPSEMVLLSFR